MLFGIVANLLSSCLCFFDAIIELHALDEKALNDFLIGKWKWISYTIKAYLIHDFYIFSGGILTLNWKE